MQMCRCVCVCVYIYIFTDVCVYIYICACVCVNLLHILLKNNHSPTIRISCAQKVHVVCSYSFF